MTRYVVSFDLFQLNQSLGLSGAQPSPRLPAILNALFAPLFILTCGWMRNRNSSCSYIQADVDQ